jgi:hypothetical protein
MLIVGQMSAGGGEAVERISLSCRFARVIAESHQNFKDLARRAAIAPDFLANVRSLVTPGVMLVLTDAPVNARTRSARLQHPRRLSRRQEFRRQESGGKYLTPGTKAGVEPTVRPRRS